MKQQHGLRNAFSLPSCSACIVICDEIRLTDWSGELAARTRRTGESGSPNVSPNHRPASLLHSGGDSMGLKDLDIYRVVQLGDDFGCRKPQSPSTTVE